MIRRFFNLAALALAVSISSACSQISSNANSAVVTAPVVAATAPLMVAAREGKADVVRALLSGSDAKVNIADAQGNTPLIEASRFGHDDVVRVLIERGADLKAKNNEGQTALMLAAKNGHDGVVKRLNEAGAKL